jgi:hypothetical protein
MSDTLSAGHEIKDSPAIWKFNDELILKIDVHISRSVPRYLACDFLYRFPLVLTN